MLEDSLELETRRSLETFSVDRVPINFTLISTVFQSSFPQAILIGEIPNSIELFEVPKTLDIVLPQKVFSTVIESEQSDNE